MKVNTLEVVWHKTQAIHAFDTQLTDQRNTIRVASGGVDCNVRLWFIRLDKELKTCVEHRATLRHQMGVGAVRFAPPPSKYLATAADDSIIIIWKYEPERKPLQSFLDEDEESLECWTQHKALKDHKEDVSDISWSGDATKIVSCGIDHSVIIWEVETGKKLSHLQMHTHYVQGCSIDPFGLIVASLSSDRTLRFYQEVKRKKQKKGEWRQTVKCAAIQPPGYERQVRLWWDDTLPGFVRRCAWSPEGTMLAAPGAELTAEKPKAGGDEDERTDKENADPVVTKAARQESVAIFTRGTLQQPLLLLPTPEPSVVTRWCPCLFELDPETPSSITQLPYRMVLAVATSEDGIGSVLLFETQHMKEIYHVEGVHYANMTDLAWAPSGRHLFVSSRDGYVSRLDFDPDELGILYSRSLSEVLDQVNGQLDPEKEPVETAPELQQQVQSTTERLSPKLEKMILNSPRVDNPSKRSKSPPKVVESKKSKKKVAFTTISNT